MRLLIPVLLAEHVKFQSWWDIVLIRKGHSPISGLASSLLNLLASVDRLAHIQREVKLRHEDEDENPKGKGPAPDFSKPCPPHICPATNNTLWQTISQNTETVRIVELLSHEKRLVDLLNSTGGNYTFFAPTDRALDGFLEDNPVPSSWSDILSYHIVHGAFPNALLKHQETLATELNQTGQGHRAQRLTVTVDEDEIASNGVLQQINHVLVPPPTTSTILNRLPSTFSAFALALSVTALNGSLHAETRLGGTTFALTNAAFDRLGEEANAYLFSPEGEQCLRVLVQYHLVVNMTLFSDTLYDAHGGVQEFAADGEPLSVHVELPTLLRGQKMNVDISRRRADTVLRINGFHRVRELDWLASDGVVHVLDRVLVPPMKLQASSQGHVEYSGGEMTVEELREWLGVCRPKTRMEL
ncbi:hypothetical protein N7492_007141 [Penicillium capsulatum]|uniref:FAS1 domain-containing protein n=1 Tax=Penicillium capsulatum TaxID=69766 RepID=A0A9W9LLE4_9EURO|nr:hypothetical protein N7492_007141 [Penicillium capsulatum]KAJ6116978.1 hypothetical protein N7512_006703 [Penicillium capsulatum]